MKTSTRREFLEKTTIHGIADLFLAKSKSSRTFWLATLLFCCGILVYSCVKMALDFSGSPMVTSVRTEHVNTFPDVLYCPLGTYMSPEAVSRYGLTAEDYLTLNDFFFETHTFNRDWYNRVERRHADMRRIQELLLRENLTLEQLFESLSSYLRINVTYTAADNVVIEDSFVNNSVVNSYGICFLVSVPAIARQGSFPAVLELVIPSFAKTLTSFLGVHRLFTYGQLFMGEQTKSFNPTMPTIVKDGKRNFLEIKETSMRYRSTRAAPCEMERGHEVADNAYTCYDAATTRLVNCTYMRTIHRHNISLLPLAMPDAMLRHCHNIYHADRLNYTFGDFTNCVTLYVDNQIPCSQKMYETAVVDVENPDDPTWIRLQYRYAVTLLIEEHEVYTWQVFFSNLGGIISLLCGASVISVAQLLFFTAKSSARTVTRTGAFNRTCRRKTNGAPSSTNGLVGELVGDCVV